MNIHFRMQWKKKKKQILFIYFPHVSAHFQSNATVTFSWKLNCEILLRGKPCLNPKLQALLEKLFEFQVCPRFFVSCSNRRLRPGAYRSPNAVAVQARRHVFSGSSRKRGLTGRTRGRTPRSCRNSSGSSPLRSPGNAGFSVLAYVGNRHRDFVAARGEWIFVVSVNG